MISLGTGSIFFLLSFLRVFFPLLDSTLVILIIQFHLGRKFRFAAIAPLTSCKKKKNMNKTLRSSIGSGLCLVSEFTPIRDSHHSIENLLFISNKYDRITAEFKNQRIKIGARACLRISIGHRKNWIIHCVLEQWNEMKLVFCVRTVKPTTSN